MKRPTLVTLMLVAIFWIAGCDKDDDSTGPATTKGTLIIESYPSGATFTLDSLWLSGVTPDTLNNIEAGRYEVKLELTGYHSVSDTAVVVAGETREFYKTLAQGYGAASFTSEPAGATIYFNNNQISGVTPLLKANIAAGNYPVRFTKTGYADWNDTIIILMDDTITVHAKLDTLLGWVNATSTPAGADIYFGNHPHPKRAPAVDSLPLGNHQIRAELRGYRPATQTVTVTAFQTIDVHFTMVLITGTVSITSNPAAASIYVNGLPASSSTPANLALVPGSYMLSVRKAGYYDWDSTVTVTADHTISIAVTFQPKPTSITVTSFPSNASIMVNGAESGYTTPHTFSGIAPGLYQIRVTRAGYFPEDSAYTAVTGMENQLLFNLAPAPDIPFAYTQGNIIYMSNTDGIIADTLAVDYLNYIDSYIDYYGTIRWSPNSEYLAYTGRTKQVSIIRQDGTWINGFSGNRSMDFCWSANSDELIWGVYCGGMYKNILSNNWYGAISGGCYDNSPAYSPDGSRIMFMYHNWGRDCRVDLINPNGTGRRNIIGWFRAGFDEFNQLFWTTDSTAIFKIAGAGVYEVLIPDSGSVTLTKRITDGVSQLRISPDRQWCAFNTSSGIYLMQVGVWNPYRITGLAAYDFSVVSGGEYVACRTANGVHIVNQTGQSYHIIVDQNAGLGAIDIMPQ